MTRVPTTCQAVSDVLFFPQNSITDIKGFFTCGKNKKEKDKDSYEKKRPAEEGASARPPPPKRKFSNHGNLTSRGLFTEMEQCFAHGM